MPTTLSRPKLGWVLAACLATASLVAHAPLSRAQSQRFLLGPGSNVGPATKVREENCKTAADGTVTCDTKLVNPPGDTPAKPQYSPFNP